MIYNVPGGGDVDIEKPHMALFTLFPAVKSPWVLAVHFLCLLDISNYNVLSQCPLPISPSLVSATSVHPFCYTLECLHDFLMDPKQASQVPLVIKISDILFLSSVFSKKDVPKKKKKILAESLGYLILSKKGLFHGHSIDKGA